MSVHDAAQAHIASTIANVNRDGKKRPEAYRLDEFLLFDKREQVDTAPVLIDDPEAQSKLIKQMIFGKNDAQ